MEMCCPPRAEEQRRGGDAAGRETVPGRPLWGAVLQITAATRQGSHRYMQSEHASVCLRDIHLHLHTRWSTLLVFYFSLYILFPDWETFCWYGKLYSVGKSIILSLSYFDHMSNNNGRYVRGEYYKAHLFWYTGISIRTLFNVFKECILLKST